MTTVNIQVQPEKSTNVRAVYDGHSKLQSVFGAFSAVMPAATAAVAEQLFFRTKRRRLRDAERAFLQSGERLQLAGMVAWSWGEGPIVLAVHGWNGRASQFGLFAQPLVERGFRVVAFDAFGHGESSGTRMNLPWLAKCITQVAQELGGIYAVLAHSMGGAATTIAMSEGLEVERAVFIAPPADPATFLNAFSEIVGISDGVQERLQQRVEKRIGRPLRDLRVTDLARSRQTPLLVIHDQDDTMVPWQVGQRVANAWPGARFATTKGLGHNRILADERVRDETIHFIATRDELVQAA